MSGESYFDYEAWDVDNVDLSFVTVEDLRQLLAARHPNLTSNIYRESARLDVEKLQDPKSIPVLRESNSTSPSASNQPPIAVTLGILHIPSQHLPVYIGVIASILILVYFIIIVSIITLKRSSRKNKCRGQLYTSNLNEENGRHETTIRLNGDQEYFSSIKNELVIPQVLSPKISPILSGFSKRHQMIQQIRPLTSLYDNNADHFTTLPNSQDHFTPLPNSQGHFYLLSKRHDYFSPSANSKDYFYLFSKRQYYSSPSTNSQDHFIPPLSSQDHFSHLTKSQDQFSLLSNKQDNVTLFQNHQNNFSLNAKSEGHFIPPQNRQDCSSLSRNSQDHFHPPQNYQDHISPSPKNQDDLSLNPNNRIFTNFQQDSQTTPDINKEDHQTTERNWRTSADWDEGITSADGVVADVFKKKIKNRACSELERSDGANSLTSSSVLKEDPYVKVFLCLSSRHRDSHTVCINYRPVCV